MSKSYSDSYKAAGVDVTAGYQAVELMRGHVARTMTDGARIGGIGGFGGLFRPEIAGMKEPILVSGTDGVGTKLKVAFLEGRHDTVGIDCVAMCVNDVVCAGAAPLFFLDYIALGKNIPARVAEIVKGVADGCVQAGCALIGGETAEMPGFYPEDEYDLAGFAVGLVDREKILDKARVAPGDLLIGIASSGVHSNGFSLVRKVFDLERPGAVAEKIPELGCRLGEALLTPTRIYVKAMLALQEAVAVKSAAHITGGGFYENIPRALPAGVSAAIEAGSWEIPPIFPLIAQRGGIPERDMYNTFNMGLGMVVAVAAADAGRALEVLRAAGEKAWIVGKVIPGDGSVVIG